MRHRGHARLAGVVQRRPIRREGSPVREHGSADDWLLTFDEAVAYLRVSRSTLYRVLRTGRLRGRKIGRKWLFSMADLHSLLLPTNLAPHAGGSEASGPEKAGR